MLQNMTPHTKTFPPLVSVIIPVKKKVEVFQSTLNTVLSQDYQSLQVVVSSNGNSDKVFNLVASLNDPRIKHVKPPPNQSFSDDWNFALDEADGEYVTVLGDDDGMIPGAISYAMEALLKNNLPALTWLKINYSWPDHVFEINQNTIEGTSAPYLNVFKAKKALELLANFKIGYNRLPCIYNSIIRKELTDAVKQRSYNNKFFGGIIPDVYSAVALATVIEEYLYASFPLTVNGASNKSSGVIQGLRNRSTSQEDLIPDILTSGEKYHKDIGSFSGSIASIVLGEYLLAQSNIKTVNMPDPNWRAYVNYMIYESQGSQRKKEILDAARFTAKSRKMLAFIPKLTVTNNFIPLGFFNGRLLVPTSLVRDVEGAAMLCKSLIPVSPEIESHPNRRIFKSWLIFTARSILEIYRNWRLS